MEGFSKMTTTQETITISLTKTQALVLFEWLSNVDDAEDTKYDYDAEQRVVWKLQAQLEKTLVEPFQDKYSDILDSARIEVMNEKEV